MENLKGSAAVLARTIVHPFYLTTGNEEELATAEAGLWQWTKQLSTDYPLWSLQPGAYARLNPGDLPTVHPLRAFARSIAEDEGLLSSGDQPDSASRFAWLPALIDNRRSSLCLGHGSSDSVEQVKGQFHFIGTFGSSFPRILDGPILASHEPDTEYTIGGYISPYEEIGVQLVNLIEDREAAISGSTQRSEADTKLNQFLRDLALRVGGRPTVLRDSAAAKIFEDCCRILQVCCHVLSQPIILSETTQKVFAAHGVRSSEMLSWAIRLSLPIFSELELRSLQQQMRDKKRRRQESTPFEREFAIHLMAHRLRVSAATIARKVMSGWEADAVATSTCSICDCLHPEPSGGAD